MDDPLRAWINYVHAALPGCERNANGTPRDSSETSRERRCKPSPTTAKQFLNLIRKYTHSLANPDYMRGNPIRQLAYYTCFQRLVWLLRGHEAIDDSRAIQLAMDVNRGFFGSPLTGAPALQEQLAGHLDASYLEAWQELHGPLYALASASTCVTLARTGKSAPLHGEADAQLLRIYAIVLCGTAKHLPSQDEMAMQALSTVFDCSPIELRNRIEQSLRLVERRTVSVVDRWLHQTVSAMNSVGGTPLEAVRCRAVINYGETLYDLQGHLGPAASRIALCWSMIGWMRKIHYVRAMTQWGDRLAELLLAVAGTSMGVERLWNQCYKLFYGGLPAASARVMHHCLMLAEQGGNRQIAEKCRLYLGYCEVFDRIQRQAAPLDSQERGALP
jgi:hypothetical protein